MKFNHKVNRMCYFFKKVRFLRSCNITKVLCYCPRYWTVICILCGSYAFTLLSLLRGTRIILNYGPFELRSSSAGGDQHLSGILLMFKRCRYESFKAGLTLPVLSPGCQAMPEPDVLSMCVVIVHGFLFHEHVHSSQEPVWAFSFPRILGHAILPHSPWNALPLCFEAVFRCHWS